VHDIVLAHEHGAHASAGIVRSGHNPVTYRYAKQRNPCVGVLVDTNQSIRAPANLVFPALLLLPLMAPRLHRDIESMSSIAVLLRDLK
jgi:hypothetical protein